MKLFSTDAFVLPLPDEHTFPMQKYRLLRERAEASGLLSDGAICEPPRATDDELGLAHDRDYIAAMSAGLIAAEAMKKIGFPWSSALVERSRRSSGATIEACRHALQAGAAVNLAGGTHHAFRDHGEGYCLFNDAVVAIKLLQNQGKLRQVAVIDLDVHQGNGTAALARGDDSIFTLSVHGAKNYPTRKERSDIDIALPDRTGDQEYLDQLLPALDQAIEESRAELVIYLAGADPYREDRLGRLALTREGLSERDRLVFDACERYGLPIAVTMAGGYAKDVNDTVEIQWATVRRAIEWAN